MDRVTLQRMEALARALEDECPPACTTVDELAARYDLDPFLVRCIAEAAHVQLRGMEAVRTPGLVDGSRATRQLLPALLGTESDG